MYCLSHTYFKSKVVIHFILYYTDYIVYNDKGNTMYFTHTFEFEPVFLLQIKKKKKFQFIQFKL